MVIAVDTRGINDHSANDFAIALLTHLVEQSPGDDFIFFVEDNAKVISDLFPSVKFLRVGRSTENILSLRYRYYVKIPRLLKKNKSDVFLSFAAMPVSAALPQFFFIDDHFFFSKSDNGSNALTKKVKKIKTVHGTLITTSAQAKEEIHRLTAFPKEKILLTGPVPAFSGELMKIADMTGVKSTYTGNKDFFLCYVSSPPPGFFIDMLKAYSLFKQRQQSGFWLVFISGRPLDKEEKEKLESYRYRDEISWLVSPSKETVTNLIASAYACIISEHTGNFTGVLTGILCAGVPVISSFDPFGNLDDCMLAGRAEDRKLMAEQMGLLYKDETYRQRLIIAGKEKVKEFSAGAAAAGLLHYIKDTAR